MLSSRWFNYRNRLLSSPAFRARVQKLPVGRTLTRHYAQRLFALCSGFVHAQVLAACVAADLFERLRDGPMAAADIAAQAGMPADRAEHLLRAAAALDLLERQGDGCYGLGVLGATMLDNAPVRAMVEHHDLFYRDLADPLALFADADAKTRLQTLWPYATEAGERLAAADVTPYTALMSASQAMVAEQVLDAYPLAAHRRMLDLGGGDGTFLVEVARRWPTLELTLADLPPVAEIARRRLAEAGLGERISVVGVDAAREPLPAGFDLVSLIRIVHDHDDDRALGILSAAREALTDGGKLLLAEPMAGRGAAGRLNDAYFNVYLLAMGSGRPRTCAELKALLRSAGFRGVRRRRTRLPLIADVLVARR